MVSVTEFSIDSPYVCKECRQIQDALHRMAKAQDCLEWYETVFVNYDQTFTVCESYRQHRKSMKQWARSVRRYRILEVKHLVA